MKLVAFYAVVCCRQMPSCRYRKFPISASVTRFGEISPLWPNVFESLSYGWGFIQCLANFWTYFGRIVFSFWVAFQCCTGPNNVDIWSHWSLRPPNPTDSNAASLNEPFVSDQLTAEKVLGVGPSQVKVNLKQSRFGGQSVQISATNFQSCIK